jgi:hypothetical protein
VQSGNLFLAGLGEALRLFEPTEFASQGRAIAGVRLQAGLAEARFHVSPGSCDRPIIADGLRVEIMSNTSLGKLLGSGKEAEVFEWGTLAFKLYRSTAPKRSAFREAANMVVAEAFGLPVPSVSGVRHIDDRWGIVMTRASGVTFLEAMTCHSGLLDKYLKRMAELQSRVHGHPGVLFPSLKARLAANIREAGILGETRQTVLLDRLADLPEGDRLCHGDFHPLNILGPIGQELLVDWLDARCGDPAADVCRSYVLMRPYNTELTSGYVEAYANVSSEVRGAIRDWLPVVAAARLSEGVAKEADALIEMADMA